MAKIEASVFTSVLIFAVPFAYSEFLPGRYWATGTPSRTSQSQMQTYLPSRMREEINLAGSANQTALR
jgi:hypothetical protein